MEVLYARARPHPHVVRRTPPQKPERMLPPAMEKRLDVELSDIDEASTLLGAYVQTGGRMKQSRLSRLRELVGELPAIEVAKEWKSALKQLRAGLAEERPLASGNSGG